MRLLALALAFFTAFGTARASGVQLVAGLDYAGDGSDAHRLDLYLPNERKSAAIVVFVHGGAFMVGNRRQYASVGRALASQGLATAVVSYRLFPQSDALGAVGDVAQAASWMVHHAAEYGLDPRNVFLVGHSAGAQIVAVIATDAKYLAAFGEPLAAVRGVVALAGAYDVRDLSGESDSWQHVDGHIYGATPQARSALSPIAHIDPHTPPTVTACGTQDDPDSCRRAMDFAAALRAAGVPSTTVEERGADHMGMVRALVDPKDPLNAALLYFIAKEKVS